MITETNLNIGKQKLVLIAQLESLLCELETQRNRDTRRKIGNLSINQPHPISEKEKYIKQLIEDIRQSSQVEVGSRVIISANLKTGLVSRELGLLSKARELLGGNQEKMIGLNFRAAIKYIMQARDLKMPTGSYFNGANHLEQQQPSYSTRNLPKTNRIGLGSMAINIDTNVDYTEKSKNPLNRFKFYHSFSKGATSNLIESYLKDVFEACKVDAVSLQIKSEDHFYDACIFYTWDFEKLKSILQKLYPKYKDTDLFASCERVFQAEIEGISPQHIAYAQEPVIMKPFDRAELNSKEESFKTFATEHGILGWSHSSRMLRLGNTLEETIRNENGNLTKEDFISACNIAGVKPEAPWVLDIV